MHSNSLHSKPFRQSVVRSFKYAWNTLTKKNEKQDDDDPFASTWFHVSEEAFNRKKNGFTETRRPALASSSFDSFSNLQDTISQFPLPHPTENQNENENENELISFLPSFDSPPSSPRSSASHELEIDSFDSGDQIMHSTLGAEDYSQDKISEPFILNLLEGSSDYSSFFSSEMSTSSSLGHSTPSVTSYDSGPQIHRKRRPSMDVRMVSDCGPASLRCWRPLSWSGLLGVVSLRTNRPKDEIAFVCQNYPNVISNSEEYDAMLAWLFASTNGPCPKADLWVVKKTLTSGRMHIGSPGAQLSSEFLHATLPSKPLRRAATTIMPSPRISEAPPLSWKFGMGSVECPEFVSTNKKPSGWI